MTHKDPNDLSQLSMHELFRIEVDAQAAELTRGLLSLESNPQSKAEVPSLMRAAHSLKGAARIVGLDAAVRVAHAMEDRLIAAQNNHKEMTPSAIDALLGGVDLLRKLSESPDAKLDSEIDKLVTALVESGSSQPHNNVDPVSPAKTAAAPDLPDKADVRVSSENLSRLLFMAGESLVASRRLDECSRSLRRLKLPNATANLEQLETVNRLFFNLSHRLHEEVLECRMRPLAEAIRALPRMARDIARDLGKSVKFDVIGGSTAVDRDVLERLKTPLMHLVRNAVDHGIESAEMRKRAGKPDTGSIRLEARHSGGLLLVSVTDDGSGIDRSTLEKVIIDRQLNTAEAVERMADAEIYQFLFLPGFSTKQNVTDLSGRGVGLDVVHTTVKEIGGMIRVSSQQGLGTRFDLELPLTLSLIRALIVDIAGEAYAFPLARIMGVVKFSKTEIESIEGRQYFAFRNSHVALVSGREVLELSGAEMPGLDVPVVVLGGDGGALYGIVVDRFLGERELVVLGLDPALGKVRSISAGALMPDDSPLLILDVDDLLRSLDNLLGRSRLKGVSAEAVTAISEDRRKRILAVDDSLTVRELERKLLQGRGYDVDTAVDGMDAWNTVRSGRFDLVVTDVDMPRMDGVELLQLIKKDPNLRSIPVLIVSYKDREEDRRRGLEAGADYYLTKGSFQDESLLHAVADLIGEAEG
jgi:two-component system sensor histidine kinase and response regulator WspE